MLLKSKTNITFGQILARGYAHERINGRRYIRGLRSPGQFPHDGVNTAGTVLQGITAFIEMGATSSPGSFFVVKLECQGRQCAFIGRSDESGNAIGRAEHAASFSAARLPVVVRVGKQLL